MNIRFAYRGMEPSPTIEQHVAGKNDKLMRVLKNERDPINLEVILEAHPVHAQFAVELRLHAADYHLRAQKNGADIYSLIDETFDVLVQEIIKKKEIRIDERKTKPEPEV